MIICLDVAVIVDRIEEEIAVLELGVLTFDVPLVEGLFEGASLRLCLQQAPLSASLPPPVPLISFPTPD